MVFITGCSANNPNAQIRSTLDSQVAAWNIGDIKGFMEGYWKSDDLVFESPNGQTKGWQATLERYQRRYPTNEKMGRLQFTQLRIDTINSDAAEVTGRWQVQTVESKSSGGFRLDMRRIDNHWVIVKDHTTSDEPAK